MPGHIAQDCFYTPGAKKYDLVEEEERPIFAGPNQLKAEQQKSAHKSKKKKVVNNHVLLHTSSISFVLPMVTTPSAIAKQ